MAQDYGSREDIALRLGRTICLYEGVPVYVSNDREDYPFVKIQYLDRRYGVVSRGSKVIDHRDKELDDSAFDLGYIEIEGQAHYLKRGAFRHQNQGLRQENVIAVPFVGRGSFIMHPGMYACITGEHKTIKEAWKLLDSGHQGVPIHRHVAMCRLDSRNTGLYYRARLVAMWNSSSDTWDWVESPDQKHIKRLVEKTGCLRQGT